MGTEVEFEMTGTTDRVRKRSRLRTLIGLPPVQKNPLPLPSLVNDERNPVLVIQIYDGRLHCQLLDFFYCTKPVTVERLRNILFADRQTYEAALPLLDLNHRMRIEAEVENSELGFGIILTEALERTYQAPVEGPTTIEQWHRWLGIKPSTATDLFDLVYIFSPLCRRAFEPFRMEKERYARLLFSSQLDTGPRQRTDSAVNKEKLKLSKDRQLQIFPGRDVTLPDGQYELVHFKDPGVIRCVVHEGRCSVEPGQWWIRSNRPGASRQVFMPRDKHYVKTNRRSAPLDLV